MSLTAFKRKSVIMYGSNISGKAPGGYWLPQGPYGLPGSINSVMLNQDSKTWGPVGFSINGGRRSPGNIGKDMKFSKNGTPFRGIHAIGWGGTGGRYPYSEPVFNVCRVLTSGQGTQFESIKPSVLSTRGMLRKKYRWIYSGQYPNYWVQPNYGTSNLSDNTSQGMYIQTKSAANDCVVDTNDTPKYVDYFVRGGPFGCQPTPARGYTFNVQQSNAPYTKFLHVPQTSGQYTLRIQQKCADPTPKQKPFPYATNGDSCNNTLYAVTKDPFV